MLGQLLKSRSFGLALLIGLAGLVAWFVDPQFLSAENVRDILVRSAPTAIVACGLMLVVVTGEIDISVGSLMGLLAATLGVLISANEMNLSVWLGVPLTLALGTAIGFIVGVLVTFGRVPSIIATLGLLTALRGLTMIVMGGENIDGLPTGLQSITKVGILGVPLSIWVAFAVIGGTFVLIHWTALGRQLFAIGSSEYSARMLGLPVAKLKLFAFTYVGFLTALATIVEVPRLPKIENTYWIDTWLTIATFRNPGIFFSIR